MSSRQRRFHHVISLFLLLAILIAPLGPLVQAQEQTPEPPIESPTEAPVVTAEATPPSQPTSEPPVVVPVSPTIPTTSFVSDFQTGDLTGWLLSDGWNLGALADNIFLTTAQPSAVATVNGYLWGDFSISTNVGLSQGAAVIIGLRVGEDNYLLRLQDLQTATLFRDGVVVATGTSVLDGVPDAAGLKWFTLNVLVSGGNVSLAINSVAQFTFSDSAPLPAGAVLIGTPEDNTGLVAFDNFIAQAIVPSTTPPVENPIQPTPIVIPPLETLPAEVTPAAPELTPEVTSVVLPEMTATPETPEITPEVTPAITPELTVEPLPEVTAEPPIAQTPLLATDFEDGGLGWVLGQGTTIIAENDANHVAAISPSDNVSPEQVLFLAAQRINWRLNIVPDGVSTGAELYFRVDAGTFYLLGFELSQTSLYRVTTESADLLYSAPAARTAGTWYDLSLLAQDGNLSFVVNGVEEFAIADAAPLLGGSLRFAANSISTVWLDDVAIYDLSPGVSAPAPVLLEDHVRAKFGGAFLNMLEAYLGGDETAVEAIATDFFMLRDDAGRYYVVIWGAAGQTGDNLAALVTAVGGEIKAIGVNFVEAYVPLGNIVPLAALAEVAAIGLPNRVTSTSDGQLASALSGTQDTLDVQQDDDDFPMPIQSVVNTGILPYTMDILGVNSWHAAGVLGAGVDVAVMDTGFAGANSANINQACLGSNTVSNGSGGASHGVNVVEVICDLAPQAKVWMYRVGSTTDLATAIDNARTGAAFGVVADVIVITVDDAGEISGSPGSIGTAITNAYAANIPVIAAAGNTNGAGTAFSMPAGTQTIDLQTSAGALVSYSWPADVNSANVASTLYNGDNAIDSRPAGSGNQSHQYVVPASCATACDLTLVVDVGIDTVMNIEIVGGVSGNSGNVITTDDGLDAPAASPNYLSTAASSVNAIAVGAVCGSPYTGFPILSSSSTGNNDNNGKTNIKPEIVAPAHVRTSLTTGFSASQVQLCTGISETTSGYGFTGTSASAAHVAGMAALLFSNPNSSMNTYFSTQRPDRLEAYLMTRTIDLGTVGFDNVYGAGLTQLGDPLFDLNTQQVFFTPPSGVPGGTIRYVGTGYNSLASTWTPDGTVANPYISARQALNGAPSGTTIIFMSGEYVAPLVVSNNVSLISYDILDPAPQRPSTFWVNNVAILEQGSGGLALNGSKGVIIRGFEFKGGTPLYDASFGSLRVPAVSPMVLKGVGGVPAAEQVTIESNLFTTFDAPFFITFTPQEPTNIPSNNVLLKGNTFTGFSNNSVSDQASALLIEFSGTASKIRVENNTFTQNFISSTDFTQGYNATVYIRASHVEFRTSRFENNFGQAVITLNQWDESGLGGTKLTNELVIFSSLFSSNNVSGSLINIFQGPNFRFTNNTVVNNTSLNNRPIIAVGNNLTTFLQINDHKWDIFNNLFYNNATESTGGGGDARNTLVTDISTSGPTINLDCQEVGSTVLDTGTRNNWFAPAMAGGDCDLNVAGANNILTNTFNSFPLLVPPGSDTTAIQQAAAARLAFEAHYFFTATNDPINPFRLRPRGSGDTPPNRGIEAGYDTGVTRAGGTTEDLRLRPRLFDWPLVTGNAVDIGAYELNEVDPVRFINTGSGDVIPPDTYTAAACPNSGSTGYDNYVNATGNFDFFACEDTVVNIDLSRYVTKGFQPYSFSITPLVTIYDPNPLNACGGSTHAFNTSTYILTYCPPANFFNQGQPAETQVRFNYQATGILESGETTIGQVNVIIRPVDDGAPTVIGSPAAPTLIFGDNTSSTTPIELPPSVSFTPVFEFSHPGNALDYPFTFSQFTVTSFSAAMFDTPELRAIFDQAPYGNNNGTVAASEIAAWLNAGPNGTGDGVFNFPTSPNQGGFVEFNFRVTDSAGTQSATPGGYARLQIANLQGVLLSGIHDDTNINIKYTNSAGTGPGGWIPVYYDTGYNRTLHYSSTNGDKFSFEFWGDTFVLNMIGTNVNGNYQVFVDPDGPAGPLALVNYNALGGGVTCTQNSATLSSNSGTTTGVPISFGCMNLDLLAPGYTRTVEVRVTSSTPTNFNVDAIQVYRNYSTGFYDEQWFSGYTPGWLDYPFPGPVTNSMRYNNAANSCLSFKIDETVGRVQVFMPRNVSYGPVRVFINDQPFMTITHPKPLTVPELYWSTPYTFAVKPQDQIIKLCNTGTEYIGIEAINLLPPAQILGTGYYLSNADGLTYANSWSAYGGAGPSNQLMLYSNDSNARLAFNVNNTVGRIKFFYVVSPDYGPAAVYVNGNLLGTINNPDNAGLLWRQQFTLNIAPGDNFIEVRNLSGKYIGIEAIELLSPTAKRLSAGYYEETTAELTYQGFWQGFESPYNYGYNMKYGNDPNMSVSFDIDATVGRIVVYRVVNEAHGPIDVKLNGALLATIPNTPNPSTALWWNNSYVVQIPTPGNHSITLENATTEYISLAALELLPPVQNLGIGEYEDNHPQLAYTGDWVRYAGVGPVGGTARYTNEQGASLKFNVNNTVGRIIVDHTVYPSYGPMELWVDGVLLGQIENPPEVGLVWGREYEFTIVPGNHTIELKNKTTEFIGIERIRLLPPATPLGLGLHSTSKPEFSFAGWWTEFIGAPVFTDYLYFTNERYAQIGFRVDGTVNRMGLYFTKYFLYGELDVYVNGAFVTTLNQFASDLQWSRTATIALPGTGIRTVELRSKDSNYIGLEAVYLLPTSDTLTANNIYEDYHPDLVYGNGFWQYFDIPDAAGGQVSYTNNAAATTQFKVDNSVGRVVVYRPIDPTYTGQEVFVNGTPLLTIPNPNTTPSTVWQSRYTFEITPGSNTIRLDNAATSTGPTTYNGVERIELLPPAAVLTAPGTGFSEYDDRNANLSFNGAWLPADTIGYVNNTFSYSNDPTAEVSFKVNNSVGKIEVVYTVSPGYTGMQVWQIAGVTETQLGTITNSATLGVINQRTATFNIGTPGNYTIEFRSAGGGYIGFDAIRLYGPNTVVANLGLGSYSDRDVNFRYSPIGTGTHWVVAQDPRAQGGEFTYTNTSGASMEFTVNNTVNRVAVYYIVDPLHGAMTVTTTGGALNPTVIPNPDDAGTIYGRVQIITLTPGTQTITLANSSSKYIAIERIDLLGPVQALTPGYYNEDNPNITFNGGPWTITGSPDYSNGSAIYTTQKTGSTATFSFTGTGFVIQTLRYNAPPAAKIEACYAGTGGVSAINGCVAEDLNGPAAFGYGLAEYGLPFGTYNVTVRFTADAVNGRLFVVDAVTILGSPDSPLTVGKYDDRDTKITYAPTSLWAAGLYPDYYNATYNVTDNAGGIVQFQVTGNSFTLYQVTWPGGSSLVRVCVSRSTTSAHDLECTTVSQNSATVMFRVPITIYGLGTGTHHVIIENKSHGGNLIIDQIEVN